MKKWNLPGIEELDINKSECTTYDVPPSGQTTQTPVCDGSGQNHCGSNNMSRSYCFSWSWSWIWHWGRR